MVALTLDKIKANCRIDGDEEDGLLMELGETAETMVENILHRSWYELEADYGLMPAPCVRAALMLVDHLYLNRGATSAASVNVVPMGVAVMLRPYVVWRRPMGAN